MASSFDPRFLMNPRYSALGGGGMEGRCGKGGGIYTGGKFYKLRSKVFGTSELDSLAVLAYRCGDGAHDVRYVLC